MIDTKRKVNFPDGYDAQGYLIGRVFPNMPDVLSLVPVVIDGETVRVVRQNGELGNSKGRRVSENIVMFGESFHSFLPFDDSHLRDESYLHSLCDKTREFQDRYMRFVGTQ